MPPFFRASFELRKSTALGPSVALIFAAVLALLSGRAQAFSLDDVAALAREQAKVAFKPASVVIPQELANLDYDGYRDIRFNAESTLWRADKLPYEANFFHVGGISESVRINVITPRGSQPIPYNPAEFNFGKNNLAPQTWGNLGFGGLRMFSNLNAADYKDELLVFSGASYFRALGAGQRYGLSARGLAVDTAGSSQEEFPRFTEFWLEKPTMGAKQLTVYALMDSARMTGAYRFDIKPGEQTVTEVSARIFMRPTDNPIATLGLAPLTSMFFSGENYPRAGDFRPEVHDSDGLMIATGDGEWLWRPLQNPAGAITTSFNMQSLKGFGLMQRDRAFNSYEDTEARYELRPSAWVTPLGDWGAGRVELLQFATPNETQDNVAAYWVPAKMPPPGQSMDFAYTVHWQGKNQQLPPNGWVVQSRRGTGLTKPVADAAAQPIQFVVDFAGPALDALPDGAPVQAIATANANGRVTETLAYKNPATGAWRMTLRVQRLDPAQPVELRAFLQHDNKTLSETWTNLITP